MEETRHKHSETSRLQFCPSCICRVTSLKTHGLCFCPIPMMANAGCEGWKAKTRSGAMAGFSEALASMCLALLLSIPNKESLVSLETLDHKQCLHLTHLLHPSPQLIPWIAFPHLLLQGNPCHTRDSVSDSWLLWVGEGKKKEMETAEINHFLIMDLISYLHEYSTYHIVL